MENPGDEKHIEQAFFAYATGLKHKHVPEIIARCELTRRPVFTPSVGRYAQGMLVNVPLHLDLLAEGTSVAGVHEALLAHYDGQSVVQVVSPDEANSLDHIYPEALNGQDIMRIFVCGLEETGHVNIVAQLDNLGKGASGAAVQNLDLMLRG